MKKIIFKTIVVLFCLNSFLIHTYANESIKYPDYAYYYLGEDRFENFNRKMFLFNGALNKYAIRPVTVVWTSIVPKYGIQRIKSVYDNVLYPRRLVSNLIQRDFREAGIETARFLTNSTIGLGGMFDPAKRFFKLYPNNEDMEQALGSLKIKKGPYIVAPVLSSTTVRGLFGKALDAGLDPSSYMGSLIIAAVKAGFTVNNAALIQPLSKTVETTYADPYDIAKKMYGVQCYINENNLNKKEILEKQDIKFKNYNKNLIYAQNFDGLLPVKYDKSLIDDEIKITDGNFVLEDETIKGSAVKDNVLYDGGLIPDIILKDFNPQHPVIDAMRTVLFEIEDATKSIWMETSIWNRSFQNRIKTSSIEITKDKDKCKFRYIMQKDKNSPVAIIFPSIGEGVYSHHSVMFAKLFYDEGYSVIIQPSAFNFSFVKSMPEDFYPGIPEKDIVYLKQTTKKAVDFLQEKYKCKFKDKIVIGTSYGAMSTLFLAKEEEEDNFINISKFISVNPPIELTFALRVVDENANVWERNPDNLKEKTALAAAKILSTLEAKEDNDLQIEQLPFNENEAKIITSFVMHQKLSDLIYTLEGCSNSKKSDIYKKINSMNYDDYTKKYLARYMDMNKNFSFDTSLYKIADFLKKSNKYKIYHSMDDYLVNLEQLKKLKSYAGNKMVLIDKGSHLGFLYRKEFIEDLKKEIALNKKTSL